MQRSLLVFNLSGIYSLPLGGVKFLCEKIIHKNHNVTVLLYYLVLPTNYRRAVFGLKADESPCDVCLKIENRSQLKFMEIGINDDHDHFLVWAAPARTATRLVAAIQSISTREIFRLCTHVKKSYGAGNFGVTVILLRA